MGAEQALVWLETYSTLHGTVEILYVVDGYEITLCHNGEPLARGGPFHGGTLLDAISKASTVWGSAA